MIKRISKLVLLVFLFSLSGYSQIYFSKRLDVAGKVNTATSFKLFKDSFYLPTFVIESLAPARYSVAIQKVSNTGSIIVQNRYKPTNVSYSGGNDLLIKNNKFYVPSVTSYGYDLRTGFFVFNNGCDTILTKNIGDTNYYNYGNRILPYKKTNNKLVIFGVTDSTCGLNHPGLYKPIIRVVDTNGVLNQTKLFLATNKYRTLLNVDTTINKGYIFCGTEFKGPGNNNNYIIKLDSNLNMSWFKYIDTTESFSSIVTSKQGGYFFATTHVDSNYINSFYWERVTLSRLDGNGNVIWKKLYGTKQQGIGVTNAKQLPNGDIIICGSRQILYSPTVGQLVGFLMRTDSSGNLKWWNNYIPTSPIKDTAGDCYLYDVMQMPDKGFAAVGWVGGNGGLGTIQQSWLLRTDSMGCLIPGCTPFGTDIAEIKKNSKIQLYPNPTYGRLNIEWQGMNENIDFLITDIFGKIVLNFASKKEVKIQIDLSALSKGMYFLNVMQKTKLISIQKIIKE